MNTRMKGPEWRGWEAIKEPVDLEWKTVEDYKECYASRYLLAVLEKRPYYCDRGHYYVKAMIPGIDEADRFPRYYMHESIAISETEDWLSWRLWGI